MVLWELCLDQGKRVVREAFICISALTRIPRHAHADQRGVLVPSPAPFLRPSPQERAPLAGLPTSAGSASALMLRCQGARMPTHHPGRRLSQQTVLVLGTTGNVCSFMVTSFRPQAWLTASSLFFSHTLSSHQTGTEIPH